MPSAAIQTDFESAFESDEMENRSEFERGQFKWPLPSPKELGALYEKLTLSAPWTFSTFSSRLPYFPTVIWAQGFNANQYLNSVYDFSKLLDFKGDPDDDDFISCSKETVERTKRFLVPYVNLIISAPFLPKISPGPAGSIDIHWKTPKKDLLVNIPGDRTAPAQFYGDDYGHLSIEGKLSDDAVHPAIIMWLLSA